jgi:hypothetical protein
MNLAHVTALRLAPTEQDYERATACSTRWRWAWQRPLGADELPTCTRASRTGRTGRAFVHGARLAALLAGRSGDGIAWKQILHGEEHFQSTTP